MRSSDEHKWKQSDDLVAIYLARHGAEKLKMALSRVARALHIPVATIKMRMSNFRYLVEPVAKETKPDPSP